MFAVHCISMSLVVDVIYLVVALLSSPVWLYRLLRTGKYKTDWKGRFGFLNEIPTTNRPRILLHAVSVGEVNAARLLIAQLNSLPDNPEIVIASTTNTGFARAVQLFSEKHRVVRYPFDFSFSVRRFLKAVNPNFVLLMELEVWPNFTAICTRHNIPIGVINGRLTQRSTRRYRHLGALIRPSFRRLSLVAAQDHMYADRFRELGAENITVTGTMKWDTAQITNSIDGAEKLASDLGIDRKRPLIVAGSTAPGEHELLLQSLPDGAQLLCAPRKPEWFDQAAEVMHQCARRSRGDHGSPTGLFLLDTIGELRAAYSLADIVVIGRSFGHLHGSDMMEPIALGKATVVGPAVADFQQTMDALLAGDGILQVTAGDLASTLRDLLDHPDRRVELGENGRAVIRSNQGATERHVEMISALLQSC